MKQLLLVVLTVAWPVVLSGQAADEVVAAAAGIDADDYGRRLGVIAHDSMKGRDTPSPGLDATARWIASEFRSFGLRPGGDDGSFLQHYQIDMVGADLEGSSAGASQGTLAYGTDLLPFGAPTPGRASGPLVVLHGGQNLESVSSDLGGRVVALSPSPELAGQPRAWFGLIRGLMGAGVEALLIVDEASEEAWTARTHALAGERFRLRRRGGVPLLSIRREALERLAGDEVAGSRVGVGDGAARALETGVALDIDQRVRPLPARVPNVVGILEGSDPQLRDEYVVFSAHMDHVGVGTPDENGDSIYNGADDDASGTVAVIEIAEAVASLETPPARSMIFLLVSGEEKGLLGSAHFAEHPPVPADRLVANLNMDMVGRNWSDTIVAIGQEHSDLGATLDRVAAEHPELDMVPIDDRWPGQRFYFRSDHYNFARKGVPILFFFNGTHEDYHRPGDEVEKVDVDKATRITKLVYYLGLEVANAEDRPQWDPESYRQIVEGEGR